MSNSIKTALSMKSALLLSVAATGLVLSGMAQAQETTDEEEAAVQDVIVITGIRGSLDRALDVKRNAAGFVDAISAEDVGKLPDQNIAEALQRIPGVTISRARGEGDFVSIRGLGPNFVRGTINNRTLVSTTESRDGTRSGGFESSTGRETNFDILPAEIIANLEVIKSPSASDVEGGIGGVVNVSTHRPLDLGTSAILSAKGTYRQFNDELDPSVSGFGSWVNQAGNFGVLAAVSYSERTIRDDNADSFGFATFGPDVDTNADGVADVSGLSFPFSFNPSSTLETRDRITAQGTIQYKLPDQSNFTLDVLYSERDLESRANTVIVGTCCDFFGAQPGNGITNPDGSIQVPELQIDGNSAVGFDVSAELNLPTDDQIVNDELFSIGANYEKSIGAWDFNLDLAFSDSSGELDFQRTSLNTIDEVPFSVFVEDDQLQLALQPGGPDLSDLNNFITFNADVVERFNDDQEFSAAFDITRNIDNSFLSAITVGARYRMRDVDREDRTTFNVNTDQISAAALTGTFNTGFDFVDGANVFPFSSFPFADVPTQQAFLSAANPDASFESQFSAPQSFGIDEDTIAAYIQADIDTEIGGIPIIGNAGVRLVQTRTDVTGFFQPFEILNDPNNNNLGSIVILDETITEDVIENDYINILPSLNLRAEVLPDLYLRFAAGKSVTRPTFLELAPGLSGINPTQRFANSGNPNLEAFESTNVDLGVEWYFSSGSALFGSVFVKDIDEFIGVSTNLDVDAFGVNFDSLSQPLNQGNANIVGVELGYQQTFDFGFGYIVNVTLIDSEAEFTEGVNAGESIPFTGVSDVSYNLTAFYERGGFNTRLSYSFRDDFVFLASDVFGNTLVNNDFGQLDGSISYTYNDRWTIFGNFINLTDEASRLFSDVEQQPLSFSNVGRRFEFGIRAKF